MGSKMLIDATHAEETRVVLVRGNRLEEFDFESAARRQLKGNIYLAKVTRVEPSLQAAFVEYGGNRHGFLAFSEIHPDYYQIPLADRQALLREQEEDDAAANRDDDDHHERDRNGRHASHDHHDERAEHPDDGHQTGEHHEDGDEDHHHDDAASAAPAAAAEDVDPSDDSAVDDVSEQAVPRAQALDAAGEPALIADIGIAEGADGESPALPEGNDIPHPEHGIPAERGNGVEVVDEDPESQKIESIGAEDALEEVPQRRQRRSPRRHYKIQEVIKRRQVILVQVVKEERGNKGAALTTYLSLAGRYCVLMPNTARGGGISRKITDAGDRRRLKEVARDIEIPQGMGLIVRTAGAQRTKPEIKRDYDYLIRMWESVRDLTLSSTAPALVYEEGSLIKRAIRDLYSKDVEEVIVDGDPAYREAKDFMKMLMPSHAKNVKPYKDTRPLFSRFQVESALDSLYTPTVTLPSGGYMVMNQTEALVAVDINSGKATREHNIEDTALKTNMEAADEIARQLRLRDLAGLIVVDFIDMEEKRNNRAVERRIKEALKNDRARIQVGHISHFGLLEMSRQRLRPGLLEGSSRTCPHCEGRGIVRSISSCGLAVLRQIEEYLIARKSENLTVKCSRDTAFYILNEKRDNLLTIETTYGISIFITPSDEVKGSQAVIERAGERNIPPRKVQTAPVRMDSAFSEDETAEESESEATEEESSADAPEVDGGAEEQSADRAEPRRDHGETNENGIRRRRRGRRGGRNRERESGEEPQRATAASAEDIPGLGDQPSTFADHPDELSDTGDSRVAASTPVTGEDEPLAGSNGGTNGEAQGDRQPREREDRRPRRGRGGRDQDRRGGRSDRPERSERPPREEIFESRPPRGDGDYTPPQIAPPAPVILIPEAPAQEAEVRKWQPPAPTIAPVVTERKSGWWSKK